jgi:acetoin utilization protein AcuB
MILMALPTEKLAPQVLAARRTRISEVMTRAPVVVGEYLGIEQLLTLFRERGLSRVPVVNEEGTLIGIVSKTDLVEDLYLRGDTDEVDQRGAELGHHVHVVDEIVRDVMSRVPFSLPATTSLFDAARRMLANHVHAVPVTSDADGRVVGILSTTDMMTWVAGAAGEPGW